MLDVAAVAEILIAPRDLPEAEKQALVLLAALHDLGKLNLAFRSMLMANERQRCGRHWEVTEAFLMHHDGKFEHLHPRRRQRWAVYAAAAGHHGRPPSQDQTGWTRMLKAAGNEAVNDAGLAIEVFKNEWPGASLSHLQPDEICALTWWLPGFVTAADWIGSNEDWFPPCANGMEASAYLNRSRELASLAVKQAGLLHALPSDRRLFQWQPRPMQEAAGSIPLPSGPVLSIIEDSTGSGKTEAAIVLAQRMMLAGKGLGLYFALPTMATADSMFSRLHRVMSDMFIGAPSLTLAHGRAFHNVDFRDILIKSAQRQIDEALCTEWLADSRRRALLSQVGVGTIDQALLAVLKARHGPLRLYGLASKILIVDEVHEVGEPYIIELLVTLLRAHRQVGGSAILLTATLPVSLRSRLIEAWGEAPSNDHSYPALTVAGFRQKPVQPMKQKRGSLKIRRLSSEGEAVSLLAESANSGAACVWVRNAVDDAISGVMELRRFGINADLLHARFTLEDRIQHQSVVLERYGKSRMSGAGRILVATQVVESSLDLDFDVMVTDIAPMAALIQRAGRLWRHMKERPSCKRPVSEPVLCVLSPDPTETVDKDWLSRVLNAGAWVYPLDLQWRTARELFNAGRIDGPAHVRRLVEAVDGEGQDPLPQPIKDAEIERLGGTFAGTTLATQNRIQLEMCYRAGMSDADDRNFPTRLGLEQKVLALACRKGDILVPWASVNNSSKADRWMMSEVAASAKKLTKLVLPDHDCQAIRSATSDWPSWRQDSVRVCPVNTDGSICQGLSYYRDLGLFFSSADAQF